MRGASTRSPGTGASARETSIAARDCATNAPARHSGDGRAKSAYSKHVKISRGGKYRVYAGVTNGMYVPNVGTTVTIHTK